VTNFNCLSFSHFKEDFVVVIIQKAWKKHSKQIYK